MGARFGTGSDSGRYIRFEFGLFDRRNHRGRGPLLRGFWREVVEDEGDPVFASAVHHAVVFLIVNLVSVTHFESMRTAIDHESDARVGGDGDMNPVSVSESLMGIAMG